MTIQLHHSLTLEYHADSTEFCPTVGLQHLLAVGTYQLQEDTQTRIGCLYLYNLTATTDSKVTKDPTHGTDNQSPLLCHCKDSDTPLPDGSSSYCVQRVDSTAQDKHITPGMQSAADRSAHLPADEAQLNSQSPQLMDQAAMYSLCQVDKIDMAGIFDLKWCSAPALLGTALADGQVTIFQPAKASADTSWHLKQIYCCKVLDHAMCLSLDWNHTHNTLNSGLNGSGHQLAVSGSDGSVSLLQLTDAGLTLTTSWLPHTLEAWCAAFSRTEHHVVFSGSDDCTFKAHDCRQTEPATIFTTRKAHAAGVCTISPHPTLQHLVATGSYDEHVRIWDCRNPAKPLVLSEVTTGGGNWRLKWHPHDPTQLLAACMYNGFAVLAMHESGSQLEVVETYKGHGSIAYGADWCWLTGESNTDRRTPSEPSSSVTDSVPDNDYVDVLGSGGICGGPGPSRTSLAATCSFYDRLLHLWTVTGYADELADASAGIT